MKIKLRGGVSLAEQISFYRQLAVILRSGLPLLNALQLLQKHGSAKQMLLCYRLQQRLRRGSSLAQALAAEADCCTQLAVTLVAVGEESGELATLLEQLADYYSRQLKLRRFVQRAVTYPAFLLLASFCVLLLFLLYILPVLADTYSAMGVLPMGTLALLQAAKLYWESLPEKYEGKRFYHISTDEVYGALQFDGTLFTEETRYDPHSPYSAAKASSDHFVRAYHDTYGLPTIVTNCSNNYGPYQFPEKLIPLFINNIRHGRPLPVYGKGENVRDWLYVEDHARAIDLIFHKGRIAETYNIGGFNEWKNIDLIKVIVRTVDRLLGNPEGESEKLITYVTDRAGHDLRYAIDSRKLKNELGWEPSLQFEEGIEKTVRWYLENQEWMDHITSGEYEKYYESMYKNR